jgi:hypothetical protein
MTAHVDPTVTSPATIAIKEAAESLGALPAIDEKALVDWVSEHPTWVPILGLAVGLSREKLKNSLKHAFDTPSWTTLARTNPEGLIAYLNDDLDLLSLLDAQRSRTYDFGDLLVARAGTRASAIRAGVAGRRVEDVIEAIALDLGLECETRTRFVGRYNRTAPSDLVIPSADQAGIVVAAKGFDSTGSKLTDAVREIEEMADVRLPTQTVMAVIDGIGWKSRQSDLKRIYLLWENNQIDGMYTLANLDGFRADLKEAARMRKYLP